MSVAVRIWIDFRSRFWTMHNIVVLKTAMLLLIRSERHWHIVCIVERLRHCLSLDQQLGLVLLLLELHLVL